MNRLFTFALLIATFALSGCNLESAPLIGNFFPTETPAAMLTFTP